MPIGGVYLMTLEPFSEEQPYEMIEKRECEPAHTRARLIR